MMEDKLDKSEKSIYRLTDEKEKLFRRKGRNETFRTVMLVFAAVTLSVSFVVPFFLQQNGRYATLAAVAGLGHSAILFAFVLVAGSPSEKFKRSDSRQGF
jgi:hypothetical protein